MLQRFLILCIAVVLCWGLTTSAVQAQDFVYQPKNPAFGGSAAHFSWMFQSAQAQKDFEDDRPDFRRDPLQNFQDQLQRRILNELSREIVGTRIGGAGIDFGQEGRFEFGDFFVEVEEGPDGLRIQIINALTGDESTVTVPSLGGEAGQLPTIP